MTYRVIVPRVGEEPFVQTAASASEALTTLQATRELFGPHLPYVEDSAGSVIAERVLRQMREKERTRKIAAAI